MKNRFNNFEFNFKSIRTNEVNNLKRLTKLERSSFSLDDFQKQVLIGVILGDLHMRRSSKIANTRVVFRQGSIHSAYLLHLYELFQKFVNTPPAVTTIIDKNTGRTRYNLSFSTLALSCFNKYYELFYVDGKKRVPYDIGNYLTPVGLAYWIMDDGSFTGSGVKLSTNAFSKDDLRLLTGGLEENFSIIGTINVQYRERDQNTIYISKAQLKLLKSLVLPYMHPEMVYKLGE
jgi:LAGLIDADG DNA endonuclease family